MPEGEHAAGAIGGFLGKTTAGLPNWAWGLVIVAGAGVGWLFASGKIGGSSTTTLPTPPSGQPGVSNVPQDNSSVVPTIPSGQTPVLPPGYTPIYDSQGNVVGWEPPGGGPPATQPPPPPPGKKPKPTGKPLPPASGDADRMQDQGPGGGVLVQPNPSPKQGGGAGGSGSRLPHQPSPTPTPTPTPTPSNDGGAQSTSGWVNPLVPQGTQIPAQGGAFYSYGGTTYTIVPGGGGRIWGVPGRLSYQAAQMVNSKVLLMAPASYYH